MIIHKPHLVTKLDVWAPRYSDRLDAQGEWVALLAKYKVDQASPVIIINFTKAKHLIGQRYCVKKVDAQRYPIDDNGKIPCYAVPMSAFESWETAEEVRDIAENIFED